IFSRYIVFTLLESLTVGILNAGFMLITGTPYVVLISVVVGITNLAPTFGPIFGGAFGALLLLLAEPNRVIPFIVFTLIIQLIDGYIVKPKLYGEALNVPSFLVLTFLVVGGKLWGFFGLLLAIPLAALLSYIYNNIIIPWLRSRKDSGKVIATVSRDSKKSK
ncbi:MAG: AI-2E family transporter, partial [Clostridiales bacterium]|nr:AI-2E family transporter [Clostridiales bacterium]